MELVFGFDVVEEEFVGDVDYLQNNPLSQHLSRLIHMKQREVAIFYFGLADF